MLTLSGAFWPGITMAAFGDVFDNDGHAYLERRLLAWNHAGCLGDVFDDGRHAEIVLPVIEGRALGETVRVGHDLVATLRVVHHVEITHLVGLCAPEKYGQQTYHVYFPNFPKHAKQLFLSKSFTDL